MIMMHRLFDFVDMANVLGRELTDEQKKDFFEYAAFTKHPMPEPGTPEYIRFHKARATVFSLYGEYGRKLNLDTSEIDEIAQLSKGAVEFYSA